MEFRACVLADLLGGFDVGARVAIFNPRHRCTSGPGGPQVFSSNLCDSAWIDPVSHLETPVCTGFYTTSSGGGVGPNSRLHLVSPRSTGSPLSHEARLPRGRLLDLFVRVEVMRCSGKVAVAEEIPDRFKVRSAA